jgi:gas vesicle protein
MSGNSKFLAGLLLGAAAGAVIAVLLSGEKGKEVLSDIKSAAGRAGDEIKDAAQRFEAELDNLTGRAKQIPSETGRASDDFAA